MEDREIVDLYWERSEKALLESERKYGRYCFAIAKQILEDRKDAEESVNDTWLDAWNRMPPHRPSVLSAFLGKITRRIAIDRWRRRLARKRGGGEVPLALEELSECIPDRRTVEAAAEGRELAAVIRGFVRELEPTEQKVFLCRYWYLEPVERIGERFGFSESKVKSMLHRTRKKLRTRLEKEGFA